MKRGCGDRDGGAKLPEFRRVYIVFTALGKKGFAKKRDFEYNRNGSRFRISESI